MARIAEITTRSFDLTGLSETELIELHGVLSRAWAWQSDGLKSVWEAVDGMVASFTPPEYGYGPWTDHRDLDEPPF